MITDQTYRKSFYAALMLHFFLALLLVTESSTTRPVLMNEAKNEPGDMKPLEQKIQAQKEIVKAVSVDNKEVMETVNRLKQERVKQLRAEQSRQMALNRQAEQARKARLQEQQRLAKLKEESAKLAIARKKQLEEEQQHLKELAIQKEKEAKRLKALKTKQLELEKKQQQEAEKLAELKKKQQETEKLAESKKRQMEEKLKEDKAKAALAAAEKAKQEEAAARLAAQRAAQQAKVAGEVDKYKALILNAIGSQWILPENVDSKLSSQFRIRLAPDGAVLDVHLTRSSGDPVLDRSAQSAIRKASPLPVPADSVTFDLFRDITLTVRPENVRG